MPGYARLYVFRPAFTDEKRNEVPSLALNGAPAFRVAHESFSHISLKPGSYVGTLHPGEGQSSLWGGSTRFSVEANRTYYLAVWMETTGESVPSMMMLPLPGLPVPVLPVPMPSSKTIQRAAGARIELVPHEQALPVIQELRYVTPASPPPKPEA